MKSKVVHQSIKSSSLEEKSVTAGRLSKLLDEKRVGLDLRFGHSPYQQLLLIWPHSNSFVEIVPCNHKLGEPCRK